jgi:hypothetical protein
MKKKSALLEAFDQSLESKAQAKQDTTVTATKALQASRQKKKSINAFMDPAAAKQLKQLALETDKTQQALLIEAINDVFIKYGKKPLA